MDGLTWANYHGVITGRTATEIDPTGTVSRAEAAAMLTRFMRIIRSAETGISLDDFILTISVEETTLPQGENFRVTIELKNNSGKNLEIVYQFLFRPSIPGWNPYRGTAGPHLPPPQTRFFEANSMIRSTTRLRTRDSLGDYLERGTHELSVGAGFYLNWGEENQQRISILSAPIIVTVI